MPGPLWLTYALAIAMLSTAAYCACRPIYARAQGRRTDHAVDGFHIAMGVAMAGMLVPSLSVFPMRAGILVFGAASVWFAARLIRGFWMRVEPAWAIHAGHVLGGGAMAYMFWSMRTTDSAEAMAGMSMTGHPGLEQLPAMGVILGFTLLGYAWWMALRLAGLTQAVSAAGGGGLSSGGPPRLAGCECGDGFVAPRVAAWCQVATSVVMAVPLIGMA